MDFFFSIIIPVFNTESYLSRCLDSITEQTFSTTRVQVIVVNDGSSKVDECDNIILSYKDKLHIDYIKFEENKGLYLARKIGVDKVDGKYFLHVDSDDYLESQALQILYENIQKYGDTDYIEFNYSVLHTKTKYKNKSLFSYTPLKVNDLLWYLDGDHTIWNKCFLTSFAKTIYKNMPFFYSYYNEDYYQMGLIQYYVNSKRILDTPLYVYTHGSGITSTKKYNKDKLKKILISIRNVDIHLSEFYEKNNPKYLSFINNYSYSLYFDLIFFSNINDFIFVSKEILGSDITRNILLEYISHLEGKLLSYQKRARFYAPIKFVLRPFWRFFKRIFRK